MDSQFGVGQFWHLGEKMPEAVNSSMDSRVITDEQGKVVTRTITHTFGEKSKIIWTDKDGDGNVDAFSCIQPNLYNSEDGPVSYVRTDAVKCDSGYSITIQENYSPELQTSSKAVTYFYDNYDNIISQSISYEN